MIIVNLGVGIILAVIVILSVVDRIYEYSWNQEKHTFNIAILVLNSWFLGILSVLIVCKN